MKEKQELWCHNCSKYVQFDLDVSINGNYEIICPECKHQHYRVVINGKITETRWGRDASQQLLISAGQSYYTVQYATTTVFSTYDTYSSAGNNDGTGGNYYLYSA